MSADFWAGYLSGALGIIVGNPLDIIKVRQQASVRGSIGQAIPGVHFRDISALVTGTAAPILGYGALNALLFVSYNRAEAALNRQLSIQSSHWTTWLAGAIGGLATWVVSCPTELVKCRAQMASPAVSSWSIAKEIWRNDGIRGMYLGGTVTALRDSIGYGFYFWSYELMTSRWPNASPDETTSLRSEIPRVLLCGGVAGIITWASVFPLDVIKTRVQTQLPQTDFPQETSQLVAQQQPRKTGAVFIAQRILREEGIGAFFRGLTVCSARAFVVNAVQWATYEWVMHELGHGRKVKVASA